jgi:hypothetical protein
MNTESTNQTPLNVAIEIHDSELGSIELAGRTATLRLAPAYVHKSYGEPGVDAGTGWTQHVTIVIDDAVVESSVPSFPCDLTDGTLTVNTESWDNLIPLPLRRQGSVSLVLVGMWGGSVSVSGKEITATPNGDATYIEDVT